MEILTVILILSVLLVILSTITINTIVQTNRSQRREKEIMNAWLRERDYLDRKAANDQRLEMNRWFRSLGLQNAMILEQLEENRDK